MRMFEDMLHNHTLPTVGEDGQVFNRPATCSEANVYYGPHTKQVSVSKDWPQGRDPSSEEMFVTVMQTLTCAGAEFELQRLRLRVEQDTQEIASLNARNARLNGQIDNYRRLIAGAMQIVFHMGPALQALLAEGLADPALTDDQTAVKIEAPLYTVLIDPFGEQITMRDVTGTVPERTFPISGGKLGDDDQTLLLGHVARIRAAACDGGVDPVQGGITLVTTPAAA